MYSKKIAQAESRETTVIQRDFERGIRNIAIDDRGRPVTTAAEEAANNTAHKPLSWDKRRNLLETYRQSHEFGKRGEDVDFGTLTEMTIGFNGSEVHQVISVM